ncbi:unnamed protein product [Lupinus luteus]|uniref:DUF155 domain-containing protein n=1 Tax=Lupinus luteus TaxID=3873 RepID=A0AAV1X944_LUPLU
MGERWRNVSLLFNRIASSYSYSYSYSKSKPLFPSLSFNNRFLSFSSSSAASCHVDPEPNNPDLFHGFGAPEHEPHVKIPVKAYFLSTSINLKGIQAENRRNIVPPSSRSSLNYVALRFSYYNSDTNDPGFQVKASSCRYMVVYQYGSAVLFNIEDHEVDHYLELVKRHASVLLPEMTKDDYTIKEKPLLVEDMEGGPDYIVLKSLDTDGIRIIGSVLGQSIALDYFVSQVDRLVEEFAGINRGMEKTGTFTMDKKKLLQLVGKANSHLADVILKVGLFERSEIAWRDAKYAQIYEYLREEYEVAQRFGNLDFKLKFVEHNIHFLQEVLQNRKSDFLEWCIIGLLAIENVISLYEILKESNTIS